MCLFRLFLLRSLIFCAFLFGGWGAISAQQPFSLLPKSPGNREIVQKPELKRLADGWLKAIGELSSVWPGGLREASVEEAQLFAAIVELGNFYGFESRQYSLSFSGNLEILLPALEESGLSDRREVVLVTPVSGLARTDIVSLLLFMALWAKKTEIGPLPVRLVFLGSELPPPEISPDLSEYGLGSRGFLEKYPLRKPQSLIYLFHGMELLPTAVPVAQRLQGFTEYFGQSLKRLWERYRNPDKARDSIENFIDNSMSYFEGYHIIYGGSLQQSPAKIALGLSAAFDSAGLPYVFANRLPLFDDYALFGQLEPYLEAQWPLGAVYQNTEGVMDPLPLAQSLRRFVEWQRPKAGVKANTEIEDETGTYWLVETPFWGSVLIDERNLLGLLLLAIALFAVCSFCVRLEWARLCVQKCRAQALANVGGVLLFVGGCLLLVAILVPLALHSAAPLKSLPEFRSLQLLNAETIGRIFDAAKNPAFDYWAMLLSMVEAFAEILGALLLLYCGALAHNLWHTVHLNKRKRQVGIAMLDNPPGSAPKTLWFLLFLAQFWTFAVSLGFLFMGLRLVLFGLYSFFVVFLYSVLDVVLRTVIAHWPLRWFLHWLRQIVCRLVFIPYFLPVLLFGAGGVMPRYLLSLLFVLPGLLLCARQIALYRAFAQEFYEPFYPGVYRRYLLGRIFTCGLGISVSIGMVSLLYHEEAPKMPNTAKQKLIGAPKIVRATPNLPVLRLEESYDVNERIKTLRLYLAAEPFLTNSYYIDPKYISSFFKKLEIQDQGLVLDFWEFRREKVGGRLQVFERILEAVFRAGKSSPRNVANATSFVWQRELSNQELAQLGDLGQKLLRSDNQVLRRHYSSEVQLQSRSPLTRLNIDIEGAELLFANFPFSVPAASNDMGDGAELIAPSARPRATDLASSLLLGRYPHSFSVKPEIFPDSPLQPLRIDLLFAQSSAWLKYSVMFLLPGSAQQEKLLQERDPLARFIFPMTSTLRTKTRRLEQREPHNTKLESQTDYLHVVQITGLEKPLNFLLP